MKKRAVRSKSLKIPIILLIAIIVLALAVFIITYSKESPPTIPQNQTPPSQNPVSAPQNQATNNVPPVTTAVDIVNYGFTRSNLIIKVGDRVVWTNYDTVQHTITSDTGTELNSGPLSKGDTYWHTFTQPGIYAYHCSFHQSMKAQITVE